MPNAPHILETALLLLAAFLIGCVAGHLLRRLTTGRVDPVTVQPVVSEAAAAMAEALVTAPRIDPLPARPPRRTPAQRLAAAVREPAAEAVQIPHVPAIELEPAAAQVVAAPAADISASEPSGKLHAPSRNRREDDAEDAAMRAIEGGWTPRAAPRSARRRVELPEPIEAAAPAAPQDAGIAEPAGASPAEIEGALSAARSAVAAASAAAEAAIAEYLPPTIEQKAAPNSAVDVVSPKSRTRAPFGRPPALDEPRDGRKDELRRIKGITPQIETTINDLGIFHFDQIADWDKKAIVWIDSHLALKGKPGRERWVEQARDLAKTRMPAFRAVKH